MPIAAVHFSNGERESGEGECEDAHKRGYAQSQARVGECAGDEQPEALRGYDKQHCGEGYRGHGPVHGEVHEAEQDGVDSEGYGAEHCRLRDEFAGESSVDIAPRGCYPVGRGAAFYLNGDGENRHQHDYERQSCKRRTKA